MKSLAMIVGALFVAPMIAFAGPRDSSPPIVIQQTPQSSAPLPQALMPKTINIPITTCNEKAFPPDPKLDYVIILPVAEHYCWVDLPNNMTITKIVAFHEGNAEWNEGSYSDVTLVEKKLAGNEVGQSFGKFTLQSSEQSQGSAFNAKKMSNNAFYIIISDHFMPNPPSSFPNSLPLQSLVGIVSVQYQ